MPVGSLQGIQLERRVSESHVVVTVDRKCRSRLVRRAELADLSGTWSRHSKQNSQLIYLCLRVTKAFTVVVRTRNILHASRRSRGEPVAPRWSCIVPGNSRPCRDYLGAMFAFLSNHRRRKAATLTTHWTLFPPKRVSPRERAKV